MKEFVKSRYFWDFEIYFDTEESKFNQPFNKALNKGVIIPNNNRKLRSITPPRESL